LKDLASDRTVSHQELKEILSQTRRTTKREEEIWAQLEVQLSCHIVFDIMFVCITWLTADCVE